MYVGLPTVRPKLSLEISFELYGVLSPALGLRISGTKLVYFVQKVSLREVFDLPKLCF